MIFLVCVFVFPLNPHVSDGKLEQNFEKDRNDLEKLASMAIEDRVISVYRDFVLFPDYRSWHEGDEGFSPQRFDEYKRLFNKNNIGLVSVEEGSVKICCSSVAVSDIDDNYESLVSSRGYCFSNKKPLPQISSLDELETFQSGTYYRQLDTDWYVYQNTGISKPE